MAKRKAKKAAKKAVVARELPAVVATNEKYTLIEARKIIQQIEALLQYEKESFKEVFTTKQMAVEYKQMLGDHTVDTFSELLGLAKDFEDIANEIRAFSDRFNLNWTLVVDKDNDEYSCSCDTHITFPGTVRISCND